jgi:hypothetical protein
MGCEDVARKAMDTPYASDEHNPDKILPTDSPRKVDRFRIAPDLPADAVSGAQEG